VSKRIYPQLVSNRKTFSPHLSLLFSAVPTVEATEAVASAKIDVAQLKRLVIVYKISLYKLATRFADSFEIIAITRRALFNTKCTVYHKPIGGRAPPGRKQ